MPAAVEVKWEIRVEASSAQPSHVRPDTGADSTSRRSAGLATVGPVDVGYRSPERPNQRRLQADPPRIRSHVTERVSSMVKPSRSTSSRDKVRAHRARPREQGLRPVQFWVPDIRSPAFKAEAA